MMMTELNQVLFVYGTLKQDHSNNRLLKGAEFLGTAKTLEKYSLYESGIPYVIKGETVSHIYGELYRVDELTLKIIDSLEGHPRWYRREEVEVLTGDCITVTAWLYFYPEKRGKLVKNGRYEGR